MLVRFCGFGETTRSAAWQCHSFTLPPHARSAGHWLTAAATMSSPPPAASRIFTSSSGATKPTQGLCSGLLPCAPPFYLAKYVSPGHLDTFDFALQEALRVRNLLASPLSHTLEKIDSEVAAVGQCTYIPRDGVSGVETNDSPARRRWRHEEVMASEYERS